MSADTMPIIKLGVPKGSLEDATINLFERAGWKIRKHTRNYFPDINDPQISASLCRVQEIGEYIEAGVLDVGITGLDWLTERNHEDKVVHISELVYSKTSNRPCRWVLAVAGDSPYQTAADLAGKRIAFFGLAAPAENSCRSQMSLVVQAVVMSASAPPFAGGRSVQPCQGESSISRETSISGSSPPQL